MHRAVILGYGAAVDLIVIAAIVGILVRRAWLSISALALDDRGYGQNSAARQRAVDLVADGYYGFISGHTHHPELAATGGGFYANSGSCTSVVEGIGGRFGLPPAYVRNQQICWLEIAEGQADLVSARIEMPGATRLERFAAHGRNPHSDTPVRVASWPAGPDWPPPDTKADRKRSVRCDRQVQIKQALKEPGGPEAPGTTRGVAGPGPARISVAVSRPGLLDGEFRRGVGFQALVRDRLAAEDGPAVGAVVQPVQGPVDGVQPAAQALRDGVIHALGGQRLRGIVDVSRLAVHLRLPVLPARSLSVLQQTLHLVALGA